MMSNLLATVHPRQLLHAPGGISYIRAILTRAVRLGR